MTVTTSGTTTYNLRVDEIVDLAIKRLGGEPTTGIDSKQARHELNLLLIDLTNRGVPLSKIELKVKTLTAGDATLNLDEDDNDILNAVVSYGDIDLRLERYSLSEFNLIPDKTQTSRPTHYAVDRQRTVTVVKLWPTPDSSTDSFKYYSTTRIEDVTAAYQYVDIAYRFLPALTAGLAYKLSFDRGAGEDQLNYRNQLKAEYEELLRNAMTEDRERASFKVMPYPYGRR
jgi:hypothetical protein